MADKIIDIKQPEHRLDQATKDKAKDKTKKLTTDEVEAAVRRLIELHEDKM